MSGDKLTVVFVMVAMVLTAVCAIAEQRREERAAAGVRDRWQLESLAAKAVQQLDLTPMDRQWLMEQFDLAGVKVDEKSPAGWIETEMIR